MDSNDYDDNDDDVIAMYSVSSYSRKDMPKDEHTVALKPQCSSPKVHVSTII